MDFGVFLEAWMVGWMDGCTVIPTLEQLLLLIEMIRDMNALISEKVPHVYP